MQARTARRRASASPRRGEELARWLRTPPDLSSPPRDELVIKVLVALRVPGVDVHDVIQVHRRHLVELMQQWTRLKEDAADTTWASRWWSTPSCSGWTRSSAGWTPPTAGSGAPPVDLAGRARPSVAAEAAAPGGGAAMSALELRGVSKVYGEGPAEVHALRGATCQSRPASWWR